MLLAESTHLVEIDHRFEHPSNVWEEGVCANISYD